MGTRTTVASNGRVLQNLLMRRASLSIAEIFRILATFNGNSVSNQETLQQNTQNPGNLKKTRQNSANIRIRTWFKSN